LHLTITVVDKMLVPQQHVLASVVQEVNAIGVKQTCI